MRWIINGELYDTRKADCIAAWDNGHHCPHPYHCEESLYRTGEGKWFLWGMGGAHSVWAQRIGKDDVSGEGMRILTEREAKQWRKDRGIGENVPL
ncbi:MAG: hypothetical protein WAN46_08365 [Gammaproteobacteria bacterium]|jgi:hypothetical protein